ncbi:hypothetical protein WN943_025863 [Citrus x changshan-huyou]
MIDINLSRILHDGVGSRGSTISSSAMSKFEDEEQIEERKSLGCFPFITSNAKIPKLYTSHFSVTFIVDAPIEALLGNEGLCGDIKGLPSCKALKSNKHALRKIWVVVEKSCTKKSLGQRMVLMMSTALEKVDNEVYTKLIYLLEKSLQSRNFIRHSQMR